jgi:hypothetical protein
MIFHYSLVLPDWLVGVQLQRFREVTKRASMAFFPPLTAVAAAECKLPEGRNE